MLEQGPSSIGAVALPPVILAPDDDPELRRACREIYPVQADAAQSGLVLGAELRCPQVDLLSRQHAVHSFLGGLHTLPPYGSEQLAEQFNQVGHVLGVEGRPKGELLGRLCLAFDLNLFAGRAREPLSNNP